MTFAKSLEARFTSIEHRVSEVASSRDLLSTLAAHVAKPSSDRDMSHQDVANLPSLSTPSVVAGHAKPTSDGVPSAPYSDGLGMYPRGPAATLSCYLLCLL